MAATYRYGLAYKCSLRGRGAAAIARDPQRQKEMKAKPWPCIPHFEDATEIERPSFVRLAGPAVPSGIGISAAMAADVGEEE